MMFEWAELQERNCDTNLIVAEYIADVDSCVKYEPIFVFLFAGKMIIEQLSIYLQHSLWLL